MLEKIGELMSEVVQRDTGGGCECGELMWVFEVIPTRTEHVASCGSIAGRVDVPTRTEHVASCGSIAGRVDVDKPDLRPSGLGIEDAVERNRDEPGPREVKKLSCPNPVRGTNTSGPEASSLWILQNDGWETASLPVCRVRSDARCVR